MKHECKKITRMVDELMTFFLDHSSTDIRLSLKIGDKKEIITIEAWPVDNMEKVVNKLRHLLSYNREREIEDSYWELAGERDHSNELGLIGVMVDEASIDYDEERICLELVRII